MTEHGRAKLLTSWPESERGKGKDQDPIFPFKGTLLIPFVESFLELLVLLT
jgi:hypothetical protein